MGSLGGAAGTMAHITAGLAEIPNQPVNGSRPVKLPFKVMEVPGTEALGQMDALARSGEGYPVLLGAADDVERIAENMSFSERSVSDLLEWAAKIDASAWLAKRQAEDPEYYEAERGEWPAGARPNSTISGLLDLATGEPLPSASIGLLPVKESWQVPCALKFGGWNECPFPQEHSAMFRHWYDTYGAEVVTVTSDVVEMRVKRPPETREQALTLAREHFVYCADIVHQGTETMEALAASLLGAPVWFFWWD